MKAFFFDVDNTLLNEKTHQLEDSSIETINKLKDKGHKVFLATSRTLNEIFLFEGRVDFDGLILANGGKLFIDGKLFKEYYLTKEEVESVIELNENDPKIVVVYRHNEDSVCLTKIDHNIFDTWWFENNGIKTTERPLSKDDKIFQMFIKGDLKKDNPIYKKLNNCGIKEHFPTYNSVLPNDINKAKGILEVVDYLGINLDDCVCFGDSLNDLEMFEIIKNSYCMGNGKDELKKIAYRIIGSVGEDPIKAVAIEEKWID